MVSKTSVPSVRCSRRSSYNSGFFSMDLFFRKPLRPRSTPADWMASTRFHNLKMRKYAKKINKFLLVWSGFATFVT